MHIGIDFDNTVVNYDSLFHRCAVERGLIPPDTPVRKSAVRARLWRLPDGNTPWTELQAVVYGLRMAEADLCPGVPAFLAYCRDEGLPVSVISHKSRYPAMGEPVDLRVAALRWMEAHGLLGAAGYGLSLGRVFFESSREEKIQRIVAERCSHFVDDLPELLTDPSFPRGVVRILYAPGGDTAAEVAEDPGPVTDGGAAVPPAPRTAGLRTFGDWADILEFVRRCREDHERGT